MTAEQFLDQYINKNKIPWSQEIDILYGAINTAMIEFAKLHVKQALESALEASPYGSSTDTVSHADMKKAILNSYPLNNIQ